MDMMLICVDNDGVVDCVQSPSAPGPNHKYICNFDTCRPVWFSIYGFIDDGDGLYAPMEVLN